MRRRVDAGHGEWRSLADNGDDARRAAGRRMAEREVAGTAVSLIIEAMHVIVDNSAGGDSRFASEVAEGLRASGLFVEVREPAPAAMFDTGIHLVSAGLALRLASRPDPSLLAIIEQVVRAALLDRPSLRRRTRSVPVHLGESARVFTWIDTLE
ncbi:MAG: hypothetical protein M3N47_14860 [Chloroflexota bacterium]|nr:hypothetical protein [Chloroflexota bacterium]